MPFTKDTLSKIQEKFNTYKKSALGFKELFQKISETDIKDAKSCLGLFTSIEQLSGKLYKTKDFFDQDYKDLFDDIKELLAEDLHQNSPEIFTALKTKAKEAKNEHLNALTIFLNIGEPTNNVATSFAPAPVRIAPYASFSYQQLSEESSLLDNQKGCCLVM